jgi:hypothetical protein
VFYLPISGDVISGDATSGDATSGDVTIHHTIHHKYEVDGASILLSSPMGQLAERSS